MDKNLALVGLANKARGLESCAKDMCQAATPTAGFETFLNSFVSAGYLITKLKIIKQQQRGKNC